MPSMPVARTELRRCLRGTTPWVIGLCLVLASRLPTSFEPKVTRFLGDAVAFPRAQAATALVVPFAAAALGFRSVVGERENGTARVLLGTELSRTDLVLGKTLGRGAALAIPVLVATLPIVGYEVYTYGRISLVLLAGMLMASLVYAFAWTAITVSISAATSSTTRAAVVTFGVVLFFGVFWSDLSLALLWNVVTGSAPGNEMANPALFRALKWLSLPSAYYVLTDWLFGAPIGPGNAALEISDALSQHGALETSNPPLPAWVGVPIFLAWPTLALSGGITVVRRGDLTPDGHGSRFHQIWTNRPSLPRFGVGPVAAVTGRAGWVDSFPGRWQPLARREFRRLTHGPGVWMLGIAVFVAGVLGLSPSMLVRRALGSRVPLASLQTPIGFFGGFGALLLSFRAVVSERDSGSIRVTAGTAASRPETLIGILVGRVSAITVPLVLATLGTCLIAVPKYGFVAPGTLVVFLVVTITFICCLTGVGVALSTVTRRQTIAGVAVLGFAGLYLAWFQISNVIYGSLTGTSVSGFSLPTSPTFLLLRWVPPISLYSVVTNAVVGVPNSAGNAAAVITDLQPSVFTNVVVVKTAYGSNVPVWYLHPAVAFGELLLWFAVPVAFALVIYQRRPLD